MKVINVVGARPNFMKMAPIIEAMGRFPDDFSHILVHTGQHYDEKMSENFFVDLGMPRPDIDLEVGSGGHGEQTGKIMALFEKVCIDEKPDLVIVVGDVNSTLACAITAKKLGIKVAHVEAGLRSRDLSMPEEINRLCTDVLCDFLFTTDHIADKNLVSEGVSKERVYFVGNVMIDTLQKHLKIAQGVNQYEKLGLCKGKYATLTMHRPSNVDDPEILERILVALGEVAKELPVVFPMHPRTRSMIERFELTHYLNFDKKVRGLWCTGPMGYLEFLSLNSHAKFVLTDSGGLQEETTVLGVPCLTMRNNTERPITCEIGSNMLVGNDPKAILDASRKIMSGIDCQSRIPEKWDGLAATRIVDVLLKSEITA